jgi:ubiquinone/menaquinone biosynthesis C-methylase UbiE
MATALPKPHNDRGMEGMVAKWYAANTGKSLDEFTKLAERIAPRLPAGSRVLEVAPGPGYFCIELAKLGRFAIAGLDISHTFVKIANKKATEAGVPVDFRQGNVSRMPFASDTFDFLLCRAAFKNFAQPVGALQEMCRVLKPGGRGLIIDLRKRCVHRIDQPPRGWHGVESGE